MSSVWPLKMCPCFLTEGWLLYLVGWVKELINNSPWPSTYLVNRSGIKDELRGTLSPTKTRKDVLLDLKHWLYWIDRKNVKRDVVPDRNQGKYISWPTVSDLSKRLYPPLFFVLTLITINEGEQRKYYQHYTIYIIHVVTEITPTIRQSKKYKKSCPH